jgi:hypothetical protein
LLTSPRRCIAEPMNAGLVPFTTHDGSFAVRCGRKTETPRPPGTSDQSRSLARPRYRQAVAVDVVIGHRANGFEPVGCVPQIGTMGCPRARPRDANARTASGMSMRVSCATSDRQNRVVGVGCPPGGTRVSRQAHRLR